MDLLPGDPDDWSSWSLLLGYLRVYLHLVGRSQHSIAVVAMFLTERGWIFTRCELAILASGFRGRSGLLRVCLHWVVIDLAICGLLGRSGLLRVCLYWMAVWVVGF